MIRANRPVNGPYSLRMILSENRFPLFGIMSVRIPAAAQDDLLRLGERRAGKAQGGQSRAAVPVNRVQNRRWHLLSRYTKRVM
jgi:hypothetical protein